MLMINKRVRQSLHVDVQTFGELITYFIAGGIVIAVLNEYNDCSKSAKG